MRIVIVTVCLNGEATIAETLRSVRDQIGVELRHLVVDGGSTDKTLAIVEEWSWKGLELVQQRDEGIYDAMSKALMFVHEDEYVMFLNADDRLQGPDALANVLRGFQGQSVLCSRVRWLDLQGLPVATSGTYPARESLLRGMVAHHQGMLVSKRLFGEVGGFDLRYRISADYEWLVRCISRGIEVHWSEEILSEVRLGGVSDRSRARSSLERAMILLRNYPFLDACTACFRNVAVDLLKGLARDALRGLGLMDKLRSIRPPRIRGA